ncbi:MAG: PadR family transcriptional regulator, partial [Candidatus Thermoplasmatota archaeon]|nr:PadR family transcriptional regulator [Candidatus Thermoplasmatota archaeon]
QRLEEEGLIVSHEVEGEPRTKLVYELTAAGAERLGEFRAVAPGFKNRLVELFEIPEREALADALADAGNLEELDHLAQRPRTVPDADPGPPGAAQEVQARRPGQPSALQATPGWVHEALEALPLGPAVQAPFAKVSLEREPGGGAWTLRVEQHQPGQYAGASACPLTFLYLAIQQLLLEPPRTQE